MSTRKQNLKVAMASIAIMLIMGGCITDKKNNEVLANNNVIKDVENSVNSLARVNDMDTQARHETEVRTVAPSKNRDIVDINEDYISGESYIASKKKLPEEKNVYVEMTIQELTPTELSVFLTERLGMHVRFSQEIEEKSNPSSQVSSQQVEQLVSTRKGLINVRYFKGRLRNLLDNIAIQLNAYWRYSAKDGVEFFITDSVSMTIPRFASSSTWSVGNTGGGSTVAGTQTFKEVNAQDAGIDSIIKGIKARMSAKGTVDINKHSSTITLTDVPPKLEVAANYLRDEIKKMSQQILVRVDIYEVTQSNVNDNALSVTAAFQSIKNSFSMTQASTATIATPIITSSMAILPSANGAAKPWDNSAVVFQALNQKGTIVNQRTASTMILNGEMAPIKDLAEISYIESLTQSTDPNSGALGIGQVNGIANDGVELSVIPLIQDNKKILMKVAVDINKAILTPNANGTSSKRNERKNIPLTILLKEGATVVIAGISSTSVDRLDEGIGSSSFKWFGGKEKNTYKQSLMLISITPTLVTF